MTLEESTKKKLDNPLTGESIIYRQTAVETNGRLLQFDYFMKPKSKGMSTIPHTQPKLEQRMRVISGTMSYSMGKDKKKKLLTSGQSVVIPPGVVHSLWNDGAEELHVLDEYEPALNMQKFFETLYGLARDDKVNKKTYLPGFLQTAVIASFYKDEVGVGSSFQKFLVGISRLFVPLAKRRGYKPWYQEYSGE
jgi:mannose-6-phosphate isomerase-like protein (cupin superfamily)